MAVTHSDLSPNTQTTILGSRRSVILIISTILCGLCCFILCLVAETSRSEISWMIINRNNGKENEYECVYNDSGKMPLLCAAGAFVGLAIAMVVEHLYILIAVSKTVPAPAPAPGLVFWEVDSSSVRNLTWHAGFFFVATWICFAIGEILLLIGMSVESGHLRNWSKPRPNCLILREGMFMAAGVLSLLTVFLATGLYLTALRAERIFQNVENVRRRVLETSALYASPPPPRSPPIGIMSVGRENPLVSQNPLFGYHLSFNKASPFV